jgi:hypothetical protein
MIYLHQPITGFITKTSQLFSGRVIKLINFGTGVTELKYPAIGNMIILSI